MKLTVNLAGASREELIELTGQLISIIEAQETRIAELEGQQKPLDTGLKERNPPSWVKANKPARPKKERRKRTHGFARRREEPTHRAEHAMASCPECRTPLQGGRVRCRRQVYTQGTGPGDRARGTGAHLPELPGPPNRTGVPLSWAGSGWAYQCRAAGRGVAAPA